MALGNLLRPVAVNDGGSSNSNSSSIWSGLNSNGGGGGSSNNSSGGGRIGNIGAGLIGSKVNTSGNSNNTSGNSYAGYSGISGALGSLVSSDNSSYDSGYSIKSGLQSNDYYNSENGGMNSGGSDYYDSNNSGNYSSSDSGNSIKSGLKSTQQQTAAPLQQSQIESVIEPTSNLQTTPEQSVQQQTNTLQQSLLNQSAAEDNSPLKQRTAVPGLDRIFDENAIQRDIRQTIDEVNAQNANTRSVGNLGAEQALTDWAWRNEPRPYEDIIDRLNSRIENYNYMAGEVTPRDKNTYGRLNPSISEFDEQQARQQALQQLPPLSNTDAMRFGVQNTIANSDITQPEQTNYLEERQNFTNDFVNAINPESNKTERLNPSISEFDERQALSDLILNREPEEMLFPDGTVPTPFKASFQNNNSNQSNNSNQNSNVNQSSGNLSTMVDLRNGVTNYDQIYSDYVNSHYGNLYNRYKELGYDEQTAMNTARESAQRMAYQRIYDLGYRPEPSISWEENPYLIRDANGNLPLGNYVLGLEEAIGNDFYSNAASYDTRLVNMLASGTDLRDDRLFDDLTSDLAGNAYANKTKGTNYSTTPSITNLNDPENPSSWNTALQAAMSGQLTKDQILHFYDSVDSDLVIPEETRKWLASDSTHSLQQLFLNMGKNQGRLEIAEGTPEEYRKAYEAFLNANPALKLMRDKKILSDADIEMNFFKGSKLSEDYNSNGKGGYSRGSGGGGRRGGRGGGGGGGGGGRSYGSSMGTSSVSSGSSASKQSQSRIHNIMKNWTF